jgi:large subunit ribosomal protein L21
MRYAIVESGGKQYRAVEGQPIDVDRLSSEQGAQVDIERVLLMADGEEFLIGTPTVSGIDVKATVVEHFRGPKVFRFKYSPKKRIRVRGGHRQQYTRLMVDFIGRPGEVRKVEKPVEVEVIVEAEAEPAPKAEKRRFLLPKRRLLGSPLPPSQPQSLLQRSRRLRNNRVRGRNGS